MSLTMHLNDSTVKSFVPRDRAVNFPTQDLPLGTVTHNTLSQLALNALMALGTEVLEPVRRPNTPPLWNNNSALHGGDRYGFGTGAGVVQSAPPVYNIGELSCVNKGVR